VIKRALEVMDENKTEDPALVRQAGAIDLPTVQKYINFWFSSAQDLFGADNNLGGQVVGQTDANGDFQVTFTSLTGGQVIGTASADVGVNGTTVSVATTSDMPHG